MKRKSNALIPRNSQRRPAMDGHLTTFWMPYFHEEKLDLLIEKKLVANRAEAIREAVRDYLKFHGVWPETVETIEKRG